MSSVSYESSLGLNYPPDEEGTEKDEPHLSDIQALRIETTNKQSDILASKYQKKESNGARRGFSSKKANQKHETRVTIVFLYLGEKDKTSAVKVNMRINGR